MRRLTQVLTASGRISSDCFILGLVTKLVDIPEDCLAEVEVAAIDHDFLIRGGGWRKGWSRQGSRSLCRSSLEGRERRNYTLKYSICIDEMLKCSLERVGHDKSRFVVVV